MAEALATEGVRAGARRPASGAPAGIFPVRGLGGASVRTELLFQLWETILQRASLAQLGPFPRRHT